MLKELLVLFLTCLLITSVMNGVNQQQNSTPAATTSSTATTTSSTEDPQTLPPFDESTSAAVETSDETFADDVLSSRIPVLVDFSISGCAPCKRMAPIIDSLAQEYDGRLKIVKLDANINTATRDKYSVSAFPTFIIFNDGKPTARNTGAISKTELVAILDRQVSSEKTEAPVVPNEEKGVD